MSSALAQLSELMAESRRHREAHGCEAYVFGDGPALVGLAARQQPRRVLELGTAIGYTACCLAIGAGSAAEVDTIEGDELHVRLATEQIARQGLADRIRVHPGRFETVLAGLQPGYDLAFFDGYAPSLQVIHRVRALLRAGGVLVCSNLQLAHGDAARRLNADFEDATRWQAQPPLEGGRTRVLVKVGTV